MELGISRTQYWQLTSINQLIITDIANRLIDSESEIQTYFESPRNCITGSSVPIFDDSSHDWEAGSSCYSK